MAAAAYDGEMRTARLGGAVKRAKENRSMAVDPSVGNPAQGPV